MYGLEVLVKTGRTVFACRRSARVVLSASSLMSSTESAGTTSRPPAASVSTSGRCVISPVHQLDATREHGLLHPNGCLHTLAFSLLYCRTRPARCSSGFRFDHAHN